MDYTNLSVEALVKGYGFDEASESYECNGCGARFQQGEVYPVEGRFFDARRAAKRHVEEAHGGAFALLLADESKYNTLTEKQRELLRRFAQGKSDGEIANELGLSASTVRHQKYVFREKAKQAKAYLALYEAAFARAAGSDGILPIPEHARGVDERFVITEKEREQVRKNNFLSLKPLVLKNFPAKEKKKIVILMEIAALFQKDRRYSEKEINEILKKVYEQDYVVLRRYLIDYGFMDRSADGREYWMR